MLQGKKNESIGNTSDYCRTHTPVLQHLLVLFSMSLWKSPISMEMKLSCRLLQIYGIISCR
jgi:hypothetical protein